MLVSLFAQAQDIAYLRGILNGQLLRDHRDPQCVYNYTVNNREHKNLATLGCQIDGFIFGYDDPTLQTGNKGVKIFATYKCSNTSETIYGPGINCPLK